MNKKTCIIAAPFATRSGYGDHSRDIIRSLIQVKGDEWNIQLLSLPWGNCPMNSLTVNDNDLTERMIINKRNINIPDIWIQITIPSEFVAQGKYLNIGITAGIETTSFHPKWIQGANQMDVVIVPSKHSKNVMEETKYEYQDNRTGETKELQFNKNAEVLFEGIDSNIFYPTQEIHESINKTMSDIKENFAFLFVGHWMPGILGQDRKDIGGLIKSFIESFKNQKDKPALVLKVSGANFSEIDLNRMYKNISLLTKNQSVPVYLIHGDLTSEEMNSLYNHKKIKAMVSFTKGEGFGRPLLEFAKIGKPVIASNWSGQTDFLTSRFSVLLEGQLQEVHKSAFNSDYMGEGSKWFQVDYNRAKQILKDVYKNYDKYIKKSKKGIEYYSKFSKENMAKELSNILDNYKVPDQMESDDVILPE